MHRLPFKLSIRINMPNFNNITLVLTSCGRLDLLERTVKSIHPGILANTKKNVLIDDSGSEIIREKIENNLLFSNWVKLYNEQNIGQPKSVDKAYSLVDTEYVFHCEDDWIFDCHYDFISESIKVLQSNEKIFQVTFRKDDPHPIQHTNQGYGIKIPGWRNEWYGFTYNPSILKFNDINKVLPYSGKTEQQISKCYYDLGLLTASISGVVDHIGWGRSTNSHLKL